MLVRLIVNFLDVICLPILIAVGQEQMLKSQLLLSPELPVGLYHFGTILKYAKVLKIYEIKI